MILSRTVCIAFVFQLQFLQQLSATCPSYTISTIAGTGTGSYAGDGGAATAAQLNLPRGVWGDDVDSLYIADSGNDCVRKITLSTGTIATFAGNGVTGNTGDGGLAVNATLSAPSHMMGDDSGNIYIAGRLAATVRVVDPSGYITRTAGTGANGYNGDNIAATVAMVSTPHYLYVDSVNNNLYFTELSGCRLRRVDLGTGLIFTVAGDGVCSNTGDGGLATNARIYYPWGLWLDSSFNIYIGAYCRVRKIDAITGIITTFAGTGR
jgi:sugar lactone lactonase YvrE